MSGYEKAIATTHPNRDEWVYDLSEGEFTTKNILDKKQSREELLVKIEELKEKHGGNPRRYSAEFGNNGIIYSEVIRHFGSWGSAKNAVINPEGYKTYHYIRRWIDDVPWNELSEEVRDDECEMCGNDDSQHQGELHVHHIIPIMRGGVSNEEMTITLCKYCHRKAERFTKDIMDNPYRDWTDEEIPEGRERWTPEDEKVETETKSILEYTNDD